MNLLSYNPDANLASTSGLFEFVYIGVDDQNMAVLNGIRDDEGGLVKSYDLSSGLNLLYGFFKMSPEWFPYISEPGFFIRQAKGKIDDFCSSFEKVTRPLGFDVCWIPGSGVRSLYKSLASCDMKDASLKEFSKLLLIQILVGVNGPIFHIWEK